MIFSGRAWYVASEWLADRYCRPAKESPPYSPVGPAVIQV
jgi:hypothetical protein